MRPPLPIANKLPAETWCARRGNRLCRHTAEPVWRKKDDAFLVSPLPALSGIRAVAKSPVLGRGLFSDLAVLPLPAGDSLWLAAMWPPCGVPAAHHAAVSAAGSAPQRAGGISKKNAPAANRGAAAYQPAAGAGHVSTRDSLCFHLDRLAFRPVSLCHADPAGPAWRADPRGNLHAGDDGSALADPPAAQHAPAAGGHDTAAAVHVVSPCAGLGFYAEDASAHHKKPMACPDRRWGKRILGGALAALAGFCLCFFAGLLPWHPVSVATGSMEPALR